MSHTLAAPIARPPDSRLFEVDGAGHELAFYHPEVLVDAIEWVLN